MILTKSKTIVKIIAYLALILSAYSITAIVIISEQSTATYSVLNKGEQGLSDLKSLIENDLGARVEILLSSLKSLGRINILPNRSVLVIIAPTIPFSFEETIGLIQFILGGGSVLIVDDFGKANTLLRNLWNILSIGTLIAGANNTPIRGIYFNTTAILCDASSYYRSPINPVIVNFGMIPGIDRGVSRVVTFSPASLSLEVIVNGKERYLPLPLGLLYTTSYSWLETDTADALKGEMNPDSWEWGGIPFSLGIALSLGGNGGRFVLLTDPDIFSNKALKLTGFQNRIFAKNLFSWLLGQNGRYVVFDESHISHLPIDPVYGISLWLRFLTDISSSWFIAPALPLVLFSIIFGYLPKEEGRAIALLSRVERSLEEDRFKKRAKWFRRRRDFRSMSSFLLRYLALEIQKSYGIIVSDIEDGIRRILLIRTDIEPRIRNEALNVLKILKEISDGEKKIKKEQEFILLLKRFEEINRSLFS